MPRKPLSIAKTIGKLAKLDRKADSHTLAKAIERVEQGDAYEEEARWLLDEFCKRAEQVRWQFPYSDTPLLTEFVASRLILFLDGQEPDLMRAFGLKRPTRGPKPKSKTKRRGVHVAAMMIERIKAGSSIQSAAIDLAVDLGGGLNERTAREHYYRYEQEAENALAYAEALRGWGTRIAMKVQEIRDAGETLRKSVRIAALEEGIHRKAVTAILKRLRGVNSMN